MPYNNVPDNMIGKMDSCVKKVMSRGTEKKRAIAICYSAIMETHKDLCLVTEKNPGHVNQLTHTPHTYSRGGGAGASGGGGTRGGTEGDSGVSRHITTGATRLTQQLNEKGGFTYNPRSGRSPKSGYMVSPYKNRESVVDSGKVTAATIANYIVSNADVLGKPEHFIGGWVDGGKLFLDISVRKASAGAAKALAIANDQLAFFDLARMETLYVTKQFIQGAKALARVVLAGLHDGRRIQSVGFGNEQRDVGA